MKFTNITRKNKGFTLIEIVLVMIILIAVFFPLIQLLSSFIVASSEAKDTNTALKLAQNKLEQIKNVSYINISNEAKAVLSNTPLFQRQVVVTEPNTNLKNVSVRIFWIPQGNAAEITIEVETIVINEEE